MLLISCTSGPSPSKVTEDFLTAMKYGDAETAKSLATAESAAAIETVQGLSAFASYQEKEFEIVREEIKEDYATVYFTADGYDEEQSLNLRKDEEKGWLVIYNKVNIGGNGLAGALGDVISGIGQGLQNLAGEFNKQLADENSPLWQQFSALRDTLKGLDLQFTPEQEREMREAWSGMNRELNAKLKEIDARERSGEISKQEADRARNLIKGLQSIGK